MTKAEKLEEMRKRDEEKAALEKKRQEIERENAI